MIEFSDDFFKPEIRDDFYIDAMMKSVWAVELEILHIISDICEKYGLQWYAGFGTLLGAIRHEGFIPWDDDLDIMMLRPDYMKLMQVLPAELPAPFCIRSPYSEQGSLNFHCYVMNGTEITADPKKINRFYGCPFAIGIDIFPLDYLPINEKEREFQRDLFRLVYSVIDDAMLFQDGALHDEHTQDIIVEMVEGMQQIETVTGYHFDYSLLENAKWEKLVTTLWKLNNSIAMMYGPEESDSLCSFTDYAKKETKIYPKELFAETYAATFEEYMFPIPSGYDDFLKITYGDYMIKRKYSAMHEYPLYMNQLRILDRYIKTHTTDNNLKKEAITSNWEEKIREKKVMLYTTDVSDYIIYKEHALDKIEEVLRIFEKNKDKVVLWWRIPFQVHEMYKLLPNNLGERFERIVAQYREGDWGILDETYDVQRAVDTCDALYGANSYEMRCVREQKKPVMIGNVNVI